MEEDRYNHIVLVIRHIIKYKVLSNGGWKEITLQKT